VHLHSLRHSHATHLLAAGTNIKVVSDRLGHASTSFTLDVYGAPALIKVHGERMGIYFPCQLDVGTIHRQVNLELSASRMIGDTLLFKNVDGWQYHP
jgi:hypothetical protein